MTLEQARAKAKPGEWIMLLPHGRWGESPSCIIVNDEERMSLSPRWITWERASA